MIRHSFAVRLALAQRMVARRSARPPGHLADQLDAAGAEARQHHDRIGAVLPLLEPDRNWRQRCEAELSDDTRAYLLAASLDCTTVCTHLRRGGPQPAFVQLPLRRVDCSRCAQTFRRPPADEADRCDVCTARGVVTFHLFAVRMGPAIISGDACFRCAGVLQIRKKVSA